MSRFQAMLAQFETRRQVVLIAASLVAVLGVIIIAVGGVLDLGWTRLIGAGLISVGGIIAGLAYGFTDPVGARLRAAFARMAVPLLIVLTLVMVGPLLVGLATGIGAVFGDMGDTDEAAGTMLVGIAVLGTLLILTAGTVWLAVRAAWRALQSSPDASDAANDGEVTNDTYP